MLYPAVGRANAACGRRSDRHTGGLCKSCSYGSNWFELLCPGQYRGLSEAPANRKREPMFIGVGTIVVIVIIVLVILLLRRR